MTSIAAGPALIGFCQSPALESVRVSDLIDLDHVDVAHMVEMLLLSLIFDLDNFKLLLIADILVLCPIVKLVLRNNVLTTLRGIENLKSIEGLNLSFNIISNSPSLRYLQAFHLYIALWLEGNSICCSGWYRAQVFSYFTHPEEKKLSSLACIDDEQRKHLASSDVEQESTSCEGEIRSREENVISDGEAEIVCLMNRVEFMKKERLVLWLREFKEWMDQTSDDTVDNSIFSDWIGLGEENYLKYKKDDHNHPGESSKNLSDWVQVSVDERSSLIIDDIFVNEMNFKQEHMRGSSKENLNRLSKSIDEIMGSYCINFNVPWITSSLPRGYLASSPQPRGGNYAVIRILVIDVIGQ
ncbi:hypothetical protein GIB67_021260 [Kingdonia uniflora]|uniref:Uncharacterized protein n=1 Tax=Kingdonia uniflora TaxID=39325 RepID=A0A7J7LG06_9MAGN|nr:hypothetical protein GIB67_021260 [Kingdonia uniflora]